MVNIFINKISLKFPILEEYHFNLINDKSYIYESNKDANEIEYERLHNYSAERKKNSKFKSLFL